MAVDRAKGSGFSKFKILYNSLHTTMTDNQLNFLSLFFSEKDIVDEININEIVTQWSLLKHRRIRV